MLQIPNYFSTKIAEFQFVGRRVRHLVGRQRTWTLVSLGNHPQDPVGGWFFDQFPIIQLSPVNSPAPAIVRLNEHVGCAGMVHATHRQRQVCPLTVTPMLPDENTSLSKYRNTALPRMARHAIPQDEFVVLAQVALLGYVGHCIGIALPLRVGVTSDMTTESGQPIPAALALRWRG